MKRARSYDNEDDTDPGSESSDDAQQAGPSRPPRHRRQASAGGSDRGDSHSNVAYVPSRVTRRQLIPLLQCTLCIDSSNLRSLPSLSVPVTLACGHTLCLVHLVNADGGAASSGTGSANSTTVAVRRSRPCPIGPCATYANEAPRQQQQHQHQQRQHAKMWLHRVHSTQPVPDGIDFR